MTIESISKAIEPLLQQRSIIGSGSLDIFPSPLMVKKERIQYRFPKSKKKRIRRKWFKRPGNWKIVEKEMAVKIEGKIYVSPKMFQKLKDSRFL